MNHLIIHHVPNFYRLACLISKSQIVKFYLEHLLEDENLEGSIYVGKVIRFIPNLKSYFISFQGQVGYLNVNSRNDLKLNDYLAVQVKRNKIGSKKALLSESLNLRNNVFLIQNTTPGRKQILFSKKIPRTKLNQFKNLKKSVKDGLKVIVRSNACNYSSQKLLRNYRNLEIQWNRVNNKIKSLIEERKEGCVHQFKEYFKEFVESVDKASRLSTNYLVETKNLIKDSEKLSSLAINKYEILPKHWSSKILSVFQREISLKDSGFISIDRTELGWTVDVNAGTLISDESMQKEEFHLDVNLKAVDLIVEQIFARNMYGIVVIDFVSVRVKRYLYQISDRLRSALVEDFTNNRVENLTKDAVAVVIRQSRNNLPEYSNTYRVFVKLLLGLESKFNLAGDQVMVQIYEERFLNFLLSEARFFNLVQWCLKFKRKLNLEYCPNAKTDKAFSIEV